MPGEKSTKSTPAGLFPPFNYADEAQAGQVGILFHFAGDFRGNKTECGKTNI